MGSLELVKGSNGTGNANVATVQNTRTAGASTIIVDTVVNINPTGFVGTMGTPHTYTDPITSETITIISEATAVDFAGHIDGANIEIDSIAPGYTDLGSAVGDIIIIRPTTQYADNLAETLEFAHEDDGDLKQAVLLAALGTNGVVGAKRLYTSSDTWSKPTGLKFIDVIVIGGGGGGGGAANTTGAAVGAGGGAGGASIKRIAAASLASSETVTVGAAGAAGTAGNNPGGNGGNSAFGTHATAAGGTGGAGMQSETGNRVSAGGAGGTAASGDINITGQSGSLGRVHDGWPFSTAGGSTILGSGGVYASGASQVGDAAKGYGAGGGGGVDFTANTQRAGGAGGAGIVIVQEYF